MSLDMVTTGNSYNDATNTMNVGPINNCLAGDSSTTHVHSAHLVVQNVTDLVGWQARLNYIGDKFRPSAINFAPFMDNTTGQSVSFLNLPIDDGAGGHRDISTGGGVPPAAPPDGSNTAQTHLFGASYVGTTNFAVSPDTPPKAVPDGGSYSAPSGGVLAEITLEVIGDETGQTLVIDLDDHSPNPPGSRVVIFTGSGIQDLNLAESALGDGRHEEGGVCVATPTATPTRTATATATATATRTATATATATATPCTSCTPTPTPTATPTPTPTASPSPTASPTPTPPQNPLMSLDMVTTGNSYNDTTNTMNIGPINNCVAGDASTTHVHSAHLVIQNVTDLVGWQARVNYIGDKFRPSAINFAPFMDNTTGQSLSFLNLPVDAGAGSHREISTGGGVPPAAPPDGSNTAQTHLFGASYLGTTNFAVSPDTPPKVVPDGGSYSAPSGGVLAEISLQVVGDETGQSLVMDLDDHSPNPPGSRVIIFTGSGIQDLNLAESALSDGRHEEGGAC
jgi:hypothetical protein